MSRAIPDYLAALLQESLPAWGVAGVVSRSADGGLELRAASVHLQIARAPPGLPFRWLVGDGDRNRAVSGVPGLLRTVRASIDPSYRPIAVRIATLPLAP
ncbi:MAG TPA: hypothetical protein VFR19_23110 [Hyphomicrobiaceae bacterium]|jgi:hypothetical protein|nr:hypothetical protein [Hyphomicrobiaceae bacterium]